MQLNSVKKEKKKRKKSISKLLFFIYLPIELNGFGQFMWEQQNRVISRLLSNISVTLQNAVDEVMEMYQELHMWDECIAVAEAKVISVYKIIYIKSSQQFLSFI